MNGVGSSPAGVGPAGGYAPGQATEVTVGRPTVAFFDPATMTSPAEADGSLQGMHAVDQQMVLALSIELSQIPSVPTQGHTLMSIPAMDPARIPAEVADRVKLACAGPLARGDVDSLLTTTTILPEGHYVIEVDYRNLRIRNAPPRTITRTQ